jgi:WD40 repeat protein
VRDWAGKKEVVRLHGEPCHNPSWAAFSPDGGQIAITDGWRFVRLHDATTGKEIRRFPTGGYVTRVAFSRDGKKLLAGKHAGAISQWDVTTAKPIAASAEPLPAAHIVRFTDGDKHLLIAMDRHELVDWKSGRVVRRYPVPPTIYPAFASLSLDGALLAAPAKGGILVLVDAKTGKELKRLGGDKAPIFVHLMVPKANALVTVGGHSARSIRVWDLAKLELVRELDTPTGPNLLAASSDGKRLAATMSGGRGSFGVGIWDLPSGAFLRTIAPRLGSAYGLKFSPDGHDLAIVTGAPGSGMHLEVSLVDVNTGQEKRMVASLAKGCACISFSPDGRTLAAFERYGGPLRLWEVATGHERHRFVGHKNDIHSLVFSEDGALLASASSEAPAYIWDVYGKQAHPRLPEPWSNAERQGLLHDLDGADARAAFQAIRHLVCSPLPGVDLLRQHVKPAVPADPKQVTQLLKELDDDDFPTRQKAFAALESLGDLAEAHLNGALRKGTSLELKRRAEDLLNRLVAPTPERVRGFRAVEALEQMRTPQAVQLLEALSHGAMGSRLTGAAAASLERVRKR